MTYLHGLATTKNGFKAGHPSTLPWGSTNRHYQIKALMGHSCTKVILAKQGQLNVLTPVFSSTRMSHLFISLSDSL